MPSFLTKTFSSFFNRILQLNQSGNSGIDTTTRRIQTGDGEDTSISLSDDVLSVQPVNDDTTGAMLVKNSGGSNILTVNTTDSKVLVGASQVATNTHYQAFTAHSLVPVVGYHHVLQAYGSHSYGTDATEEALGNSTDPALSYDMSSGSDSFSWVPLLWRVQDNITIDAVSSSVGSSSGTSNKNFHLMSYTIVNTIGATSGDLSDGTLLAHVSSISARTDRLTYSTHTIESADVDADKVIVATIESAATGPVSAVLTMKYHIR